MPTLDFPIKFIKERIKKDMFFPTHHQRKPQIKISFADFPNIKPWTYVVFERRRCTVKRIFYLERLIFCLEAVWNRPDNLESPYRPLFQPLKKFIISSTNMRWVIWILEFLIFKAFHHSSPIPFWIKQENNSMQIRKSKGDRGSPCMMPLKGWKYDVCCLLNLMASKVVDMHLKIRLIMYSRKFIILRR